MQATPSLDTTAILQRDVLMSFNHPLGHLIYYYPTGPYQGSGVEREIVAIAMTGCGSITVPAGAWWMCSVRSEDIKAVHADIMACTSKDDLWTLKDKWHHQDGDEVQGDALQAIPLVFELRTGATVEVRQKQRTYKVQNFGAWNQVIESQVDISTDYKVTYKGNIYYSSDFEHWIPTGSDDLPTRQELVIAGLQKILLKIAQQEDFWR